MITEAWRCTGVAAGAQASAETGGGKPRRVEWVLASFSRHNGQHFLLANFSKDLMHCAWKTWEHDSRTCAARGHEEAHAQGDPR